MLSGGKKQKQTTVVMLKRMAPETVEERKVKGDGKSVGMIRCP